MNLSKLSILLNTNGPKFDPQTFLPVSLSYPESSEIKLFLFNITLLLTYVVSLPFCIWHYPPGSILPMKLPGLFSIKCIEHPDFFCNLYFDISFKRDISKPPPVNLSLCSIV